MGFHFLVSDTGRWYGWWSGFGADLGYAGVMVVWWRHWNCHTEGCWRIGRHQLDVKDGRLKLCHRHHPAEHISGRSLPHEVILRLHRERGDG